ncbi:MAG: hypothetical protein AAGE01_07915 [Pseudomonadota bacterium]
MLELRLPARTLISHGRFVAATGLLLVAMLGGCASFERPAAPADAYYCRADSAVKYRGKADPRARTIRPAPEHGSCRHQ